jgi:hypothetical protein
MVAVAGGGPLSRNRNHFEFFSTNGDRHNTRIIDPKRGKQTLFGFQIHHLDTQCLFEYNMSIPCSVLPFLEQPNS